MKKILVLLSLILFISGCNTKKSTNEEKVIYTTIYPIEYVVNTLVGEEISVKSIINPGGDAHTFEPTQKQISELAEAEMFFYLGLGLEEAAAKTTAAIEDEDVVIIEVGAHLDLEYGEDKYDDEHDDDEHKHSHNHANHHIWIDPIYMIDIAMVIKNSLVEQYPDLEQIINDNYEVLINDLYKLDSTYRERLALTDKDTFIVSHDAFAHLEKYDINSVPVKDEVHSKDPTQQEINEIIAIGKQEELKYVFYEQNIPCLPLDVIKNELDADKLIIHNLSVRTADDIKSEKDYIDLMLENLEILETSLNE